jgi:hypothetical protein
LNEEVLSASASHVALRAVRDDEARSAARYSDAAGVENHPQITDFVPRQYRTIALVALLGVASAAALAAVNFCARSPAGTAVVSPTAELAANVAVGIATWMAAVVLLLAAAGCALIYSIRRHRIDDYRGRYRIWLASAAACLLLSVSSVAALHDVLAAVLANVTGWTALREGAVWWLTVGLLPLGWIFVRTLLDARECRLAAALMMAAALAYATSAAAYFGALSNAAATLDVILTGGTAVLLGHWLLFAAVASYARFVVLDAQGLVPMRPRIKHPRKDQSTSTSPTASLSKPTRAASPSVLSAGGYSRQRPANDLPPAKPANAADWVDGSRPERDPYEDDRDDDPQAAGRKLSKADRKRLRKLKAQNRAA